MNFTQRYRGDGTTTRQMEAAPRDAMFIWCNGHFDYPKRLARGLGREDLQIVGPSWLDERRYRGMEMTGLVIDHACVFDRLQYERLQEALLYVRPGLATA